MARRIFNVAVVAAVFALVLPVAAAHAGAYHVYSCRTPSGESAPVDGWSGSVAAGGAFDDYALNTCGEGGALVAALGDATIHAANVDRATWAFSASGMGHARPVRRSGARATPVGGAVVNASYELWLAGPDPNHTFDECLYVIACFAEGDSTQPASLAQSSCRASCDISDLTLDRERACAASVAEYKCPAGTGDPNGYAAALYLFAADLTLEENEAPHASNASGELATAPVLEGQSDISFEATDAGSGVYEAVFASTARRSSARSSTRTAAVARTSGRRRMGWRRSCTCSRARRR